MPHLTDKEKDLAQTAGEQLYHWAITGECHAAIVRADLNRYALARSEYEEDAKAANVTFPTTDEGLDEQIRECEKVIETKEGSDDFKDHIAIFNACTYVSRLMIHKLSNISEHVVLEAYRVRTEHFKKNPIQRGPEPPWPNDPNAALLRIYGMEEPNTGTTSDRPSQPDDERAGPREDAGSDLIAGVDTDKEQDEDSDASDTEYDLSVAMPSPPLRWSKVNGCSNRVPVSLDAISRYKTNPDRLQGKVFITPKTLNSEENDAFRVHAIIAANGKHIFYLTFAGEGTEAVGYEKEGMLDLLEGAKEVMLRGH